MNACGEIERENQFGSDFKWWRERRQIVESGRTHRIEAGSRVGWGSERVESAGFSNLKPASSPFQWKKTSVFSPFSSVMAALTSSVIVSLLILTPRAADSSTRRPNIVFVLADDLGWNEVPWHNSNLRYGLN